MFLFVAKFVHADTIFIRIFHTLTHTEDAGKSDELEDCRRLLQPSRCRAASGCDPALLWGAEGTVRLRPWHRELHQGEPNRIVTFLNTWDVLQQFN